MIEVSVYIISICIMFAGLGVASFIEGVFDFIKKGKWYAAIILIVSFVILYFIAMEVFKCIGLLN